MFEPPVTRTWEFPRQVAGTALLVAAGTSAGVGVPELLRGSGLTARDLTDHRREVTAQQELRVVRNLLAAAPSMTGALVGARLALWGLALGMILGGAFMLVHLCWIGRLGEKLRATGSMFWRAAVTGSLTSLRVTGEAPDAVSLPYSVPLGLGSLAVLAASGICR